MGFRVKDVAKTDEACTCMLRHCIWTGWNWQDKRQELGGWAPNGSVLVLASSHKGKSWGGHHPGFDD